MSEELEKQVQMITVPSSRFGDLEVPADSVIEFPAGIIGFPSAKSFIMLEHKPPFSWLQSTQDTDLAFVVVDGEASHKKTILAIPARKKRGTSVDSTVVVNQQNLARLKIVRQLTLVVNANNFFQQHI
jgi:flagellar assembly factor FliW